MGDRYVICECYKKKKEKLLHYFQEKGYQDVTVELSTERLEFPYVMIEVPFEVTSTTKIMKDGLTKCKTRGSKRFEGRRWLPAEYCQFCGKQMLIRESDDAKREDSSAENGGA